MLSIRKHKLEISVVIPIYKINLNASENKSLHQCLKILKNYEISFIFPKGFDFKLFCDKNEIIEREYCINKITFDNKYFNGIEGYNRLLLSNIFYSAFSDFDYILIYQLDAWVFRDDLDFWSSLKYDYIGAPWVNIRFQPDGPIVYGVGNGGFSLRKVSSFLKILKSSKFKYIPVHNFSNLLQQYSNKFSNKEVNKFYGFIFILAIIKSFMKSTGYMNNLNYMAKYSEINEDVFWGLYVPKIFDDFSIPSVDVAARFSIETNPESSLMSISPDLPFGCHAWEKWGREFWQLYMEK